ncbi:MAG: hypothetical protein FWG55_09110 [Candidatus Bathyarchaeota archaeon]|nr:hypothetical protein [Candidatus Termiticorpusculum sp.]
MSETDSYWVTLVEKIVGIILIIISGLMLYYTATTTALGTYNTMFGVLGAVVLIVGIFLLIVRPPE